MKVERDRLQATIAKMKNEGYDYLVKITAVDYVDHIDVIYVLRDIKENKDETLEVTIDPSAAWVPTIIDHHLSADWYERELSEMFGIDVVGRRIKRLLLEKWDGKDPPLRKSFLWAQPYKSADEK